MFNGRIPPGLKPVLRHQDTPERHMGNNAGLGGSAQGSKDVQYANSNILPNNDTHGLFNALKTPTKHLALSNGSEDGLSDQDSGSDRPSSIEDSPVPTRPDTPHTEVNSVGSSPEQVNLNTSTESLSDSFASESSSSSKPKIFESDLSIDGMTRLLVALVYNDHNGDILAHIHKNVTSSEGVVGRILNTISKRKDERLTSCNEALRHICTTANQLQFESNPVTLCTVKNGNQIFAVMFYGKSGIITFNDIQYHITSRRFGYILEQLNQLSQVTTPTSAPEVSPIRSRAHSTTSNMLEHSPQRAPNSSFSESIADPRFNTADDAIAKLLPILNKDFEKDPRALTELKAWSEKAIPKNSSINDTVTNEIFADVELWLSAINVSSSREELVAHQKLAECVSGRFAENSTECTVLSNLKGEIEKHIDKRTEIDSILKSINDASQPSASVDANNYESILKLFSQAKIQLAEFGMGLPENDNVNNVLAQCKAIADRTLQHSRLQPSSVKGIYSCVDIAELVVKNTAILLILVHLFGDDGHYKRQIEIEFMGAVHLMLKAIDDPKTAAAAAEGLLILAQASRERHLSAAVGFVLLNTAKRVKEYASKTDIKTSALVLARLATAAEYCGLSHKEIQDIMYSATQFVTNSGGKNVEKGNTLKAIAVSLREDGYYNEAADWLLSASNCYDEASKNDPQNSSMYKEFSRSVQLMAAQTYALNVTQCRNSANKNNNNVEYATKNAVSIYLQFGYLEQAAQLIAYGDLSDTRKLVVLSYNLLATTVTTTSTLPTSDLLHKYVTLVRTACSLGKFYDVQTYLKQIDDLIPTIVDEKLKKEFSIVAGQLVTSEINRLETLVKAKGITAEYLVDYYTQIALLLISKFSFLSSKMAEKSTAGTILESALAYVNEGVVNVQDIKNHDERNVAQIKLESLKYKVIMQVNEEKYKAAIASSTFQQALLVCQDAMHMAVEQRDYMQAIEFSRHAIQTAKLSSDVKLLGYQSGLIDYATKLVQLNPVMPLHIEQAAADIFKEYWNTTTNQELESYVIDLGVALMSAYAHSEEPDLLDNIYKELCDVIGTSENTADLGKYITEEYMFAKHVEICNSLENLQVLDVNWDTLPITTAGSAQSSEIERVKARITQLQKLISSDAADVEDISTSQKRLQVQNRLQVYLDRLNRLSGKMADQAVQKLSSDSNGIQAIASALELILQGQQVEPRQIESINRSLGLLARDTEINATFIDNLLGYAKLLRHSRATSSCNVMCQHLYALSIYKSNINLLTPDVIISLVELIVSSAIDSKNSRLLLATFTMLRGLYSVYASSDNFVALDLDTSDPVEISFLKAAYRLVEHYRNNEVLGDNIYRSAVDIDANRTCNDTFIKSWLSKILQDSQNNGQILYAEGSVLLHVVELEHASLDVKKEIVQRIFTRYKDSIKATDSNELIDNLRKLLIVAQRILPPGDSLSEVQIDCLASYATKPADVAKFGLCREFVNEFWKLWNENKTIVNTDDMVNSVIENAAVTVVNRNLSNPDGKSYVDAFVAKINQEFFGGAKTVAVGTGSVLGGLKKALSEL